MEIGDPGDGIASALADGAGEIVRWNRERAD